MYSRCSLTIIKPELTYFICLIFAQVQYLFKFTKIMCANGEMLWILWIFKLELQQTNVTRNLTKLWLIYS